MTNALTLRSEILEKVQKYYHAVFVGKNDYKPGDRINYGGRVFDDRELVNLVESALDFWLTAGRYTQQFEKEFAQYLCLRYCLLTNSGSSANLLAFMSLTSPTLGDKRIKRGDEVITVAAAFPTTVTPLIQYGAIPVFVDITLPSYNVDVRRLESALSDKTKAVMLAHTMGNPFDVQAVKAFCDKHQLWLIEDNCDALGARYRYNGHWKYTGTFGHIGTSSFYPPHHMTMGEGGAVYTNDAKLKLLLASFRDWGRACWCATGKDNTCNKRFAHDFIGLPKGYDHKYVYSHFGYNLKVTDMQAAIGCAQLKKLPGFIEARKKNWTQLYQALVPLSDKFVLPQPTQDSDPSWFGFLLTLKEGSGLTRRAIMAHLEKQGIQTRMLFSGNLLQHPCFDEMRKTKKGYRIAGDLSVTDKIMRDTFWVGVYPGMTAKMIEHTIAQLGKAVSD